MSTKPTCNLCGGDIIGTADRLLATAYATFKRDDQGEVDIEYLGESKIHWDTQEPDRQDGEIMVECGKGHHTIKLTDVVWVIDGCVVTDEEASEGHANHWEDVEISNAEDWRCIRLGQIEPTAARWAARQQPVPISGDAGPEGDSTIMTRFYVTKAWHDWPEGGSYGTIVETTEPGDDPEAMCAAEMAASQANDDDDPECDEAYYLAEYGDSWTTIDCFDLDNFIARHSTAAPYVALRYTIDRLERIKAYGDAMDSEDGDGPQPPNGDDYNEIFGWAMAALSHARSAPAAPKIHVTLEFFKGLVERIRVFDNEQDADAERARVGEWESESDSGLLQHEVEVE